MPQITRVRPGPAAQEWVGHCVTELKGLDPFAPVTLIAPNYYAGRQTRWALARGGGYVNVRSMLLGDVASQIVGALPDSEGPLTPVLEEAAVRRAVLEVGGVLSAVGHHRALHQALLMLFRELRRTGVWIEAPPTEMARAALDAYGVFQRLTGQYTDRTSIRERATSRLVQANERPRELVELGGFIVYLPPRVDPVDARLLAALARWSPLHIGLAWFDAPDEADLANEAAAGAASEFLRAFTELDLGLGETREEHQIAQATLAVIRAPDPAEEIREVTRSMARDLAAEVPLHRIAVLYRQVDPYGPLLRDSLTLAGIPWSALEGRALSESRPGRALLSLLTLRQREFTREAVLGWIDAAPVAQAGLPGSAWDRIARAANIVRGATQWIERLQHYAARQSELSRQREDEGNQPSARSLAREADLARRMGSWFASMEAELVAPADGSPWDAFVTWAHHLWRTLCGGVAKWPDEERPYARDIAATLLELRQADRLEQATGTDASMFLQTLRDSLEGRARPVGSLGRGVLVGPIQSVTGLAFDRVYIVGMTEGAYPISPPTDPFFPSAAEDPLQSRERQRRSERLHFRSALAAADGGRVTLSVPDSFGDREAFPSPWLLELASQPSGLDRVFTSTFHQFDEALNADWLRVVASTLNGAQRSTEPVDLEDRRLHEAVLAPRLRCEPIAARADLPLGAGLVAADARRSADFTAFDGNLAELARDAEQAGRLLDSARRISASGVQTWATCPFQFFLGRVMHITPTDRPEDRWTVDPLERGTLVHRILERFFTELDSAGRLANLGDYDTADRQLLEQIASECFEDLERRGVTGHPLVWENTSAAIRADLRTFLIRDERWRRDENLRPHAFEQAFGLPRPGTWPALELDMAGTHVKFRGSIDRVDLDRRGGRGFVYDYKTGGSSSYRNAEDPVWAGKRVQLALYRQALLAALPEVESVGAAFWFITSKGEFRMVPIDDAGRGGDSRLFEVLEATANGILSGAFPQVPGNETARPGVLSWDNCVYCGFDRVCPAGRDAVYERKQHTPGYKLHSRLALAIEPDPEDE